MATLHGLSTDGVIALSDGELARLTYEYIGGKKGADEDDRTDALYFLVTEAFERFAAEVERAEVERNFRQSYPDPETFEREFADALDGIRRRQATRMIRDALGGNNALARSSPHADEQNAQAMSCVTASVVAPTRSSMAARSGR